MSINDKKKEYYDRLKYITKHSELMNSYIYDYDIEPANKHQSMLVRVTISSIPKIEKNKVASKSTKILLVNKKKYE